MRRERAAGLRETCLFPAARVFVFLAILLGSAACTKKSSKPAANEPEDVKRGRTVYMSNCIACHNSNPRSAGTLGPDVHGSSAALLEAKVLKGVYPPSHEPKRKSQAMPPLPQLAGDIAALHAFLNAP